MHFNAFVESQESLQNVPVSWHYFMSLIVDPLQIQEEMEMWKMRGMEVQMSQHKPFSNQESVRWGKNLI